MAITYLRDVLGDAVAHVCSELPGPDEMAALLPLVQVERLPSPPMANRYALDVARMDISARVATGRPDAITLATLAGAHIRAMPGRTIAGVTVSTVRRQTGPEERADENTNLRVAGFTCELYLRSIPQT
ncbi:hypothetical protein [Allonocardiopsis opalescens]|uniref:hypothetical protein n=1 Tax=Allonocardiopsis opalescens TaxID=1144618 RepID=UPI0011B23318|nr:hypothetical protein [Allonocardiopsis opalescens]